MKSKEEILDQINDECDTCSPRELCLQAMEKYATQQKSELQKEVERLKLALEQCKRLTTWGTKDATHVFNQIDKIASKALNPPTR